MKWSDRMAPARLSVALPTEVAPALAVALAVEAEALDPDLVPDHLDRVQDQDQDRDLALVPDRVQDRVLALALDHPDQVRDLDLEVDLEVELVATGQEVPLEADLVLMEAVVALAVVVDPPAEELLESSVADLAAPAAETQPICPPPAKPTLIATELELVTMVINHSN